MDKVLDELKTLNAKLDGITAAQEDEDDEEAARRDEEDAKRHEEEAATSLSAARRARDDDDEEDAKRHEEEAKACMTKAFQARMKASGWHAAMAARRREEGDEGAAKKHDEDAARLKAAAEDAKKRDDEDARRRDDEDAARKDDEGDENEDAMGRMFALFMRAARRDEDDEDATASPLKRKAKPLDEDMMGRFMAAAVKAMTFQPGVSMGKKRRSASAVHDDEAEDRALIERMLRQKKGMAASATVDIVTRRQLRELRASVELLTDTVRKMAGLLTDGTQPRNLITDTGSRGPNGGAAPARRSMQGTGEQWVDKYAQHRNRSGGKKTENEATQELIAQGITDPRDQMARLLDMHARGEIAVTQ